jgi:hypothetical protein
MDRYDAYEHTRQLYTENLWLLELATAAAQELRRLASSGAPPTDQRPRHRLHHGPEDRSRFYPGF